MHTNAFTNYLQIKVQFATLTSIILIYTKISDIYIIQAS